MNIKCAQNGKWSYLCESAFDGRTVVLTNIFLEGIQELHRLSAMVDAERLEFAAIQILVTFLSKKRTRPFSATFQHFLQA